MLTNDAVNKTDNTTGNNVENTIGIINVEEKNNTPSNASELDLLIAFENTVSASQWVYRKILKAMSEPATIVSPLPAELSLAESDSAIVPKLYAENWQHDGLYSTTWSVAQTLLDSDCQVAVSPALSQKSVLQSIGFYTDAKITSNAKQVQFFFMNCS